jgi:hypothetical protein
MSLQVSLLFCFRSQEFVIHNKTDISERRRRQHVGRRSITGKGYASDFRKTNIFDSECHAEINYTVINLTKTH